MVFLTKSLCRCLETGQNYISDTFNFIQLSTFRLEVGNRNLLVLQSFCTLAKIILEMFQRIAYCMN